MPRNHEIPYPAMLGLVNSIFLFYRTLPPQELQLDRYKILERAYGT